MQHRPQRGKTSGPPDPAVSTLRQATRLGSDSVASPIPCLTIVYHPNLQRVGERVFLPELEGAAPVEISRLQPDFFLPYDHTGAPLADEYLSRRALVLKRMKHGTIEISNPGETRATLDGKPIGQTCTLSSAELEEGALLELQGRVLLLLHEHHPEALEPPPTLGLLGESTAMERLRAEILRAASLDSCMLIRGETGSGKELVANAVHAASNRHRAPFISVNFAAVPTDLAAAELFGHTQGAFSGATHARKGYFEQADGGTLFLDEIGEAPEGLQPLLLRTLETGDIQPVGASETKRVNVRVIAATDANLEEAIADGRFRAPLYHRLAGYEVAVAPLRERRDDIPRLLLHFLRQELAGLGAENRLSEQEPAWLPLAIMGRVVSHTWPGNVRELRNAARRLAAQGRDQQRLDPNLLSFEDEIRRPAPPEPSKGAEVSKELSDADVKALLRTHDWQAGAAAAAAGVTRKAFYIAMHRAGVRTAQDITPEEVIRALEATGQDEEQAAAVLEISKRALLLRLKQLKLK